MNYLFPARGLTRTVGLLIALGAASLPVWGATSNSVVITDQSGTSQSNHPFTISRVFAEHEIAHFAQARLNGTLLNTQCDVKTRWPDGSVRHAMVSFVAPLNSGGSLTVDFVDQSSGNNTGFLASTAEMLQPSWMSGQPAWDATMTFNFGGSSVTKSARTMLSNLAIGASTVRYWLQGSIVTQVIVEDRSPALSEDFGSDSYRALHPIFVLTFYKGWNGVKVEYITENMWTTKIEDQSYALDIKAGAPLLTVYSKPSFTHFAKSRWRKVFWSGTAVGAANIDYNFAYLTYSKAIPNYDPTKKPPSSTVSSLLTTFNSTDQGDINGNAQWLKYMPQTGGRDDIGLFPAWYADYFYTFDPSLYKVMLGNAAVSGYVPLHLRESDSTLSYDSAKSVGAFGRSTSIDARTTLWGTNTGVAAVGTVGSTGWTVDVAHEGSYVYIPYLITGDWYFLEELYQWAANCVAAGDPANVAWGRHGTWGLLSWGLQTRGMAWGLRDIMHAAVMAPDGTPEKAYYTEKINNNIAAREGNAGITNGSFYDPSPSSVWTWGRNNFSNGVNPSPLGNPNYPDVYGSKDNTQTSGPYATEYIDSPWQYGYLMLTYGHMKELGFAIDSVQKHFAKYFINAAANPSYNPWLMGMYRFPVTQASTKQYYTSWSDVKQAYDSASQALTAWPANGSDDSNISHGYPHIAKAAVSFTVGLFDGAYSGQAAWNWINSAVGYQNAVSYNPRWAIIPRGAATAPSCDLNGDGKVDAADVQISVNGALGLSVVSNGDITQDGRLDVVDTQRVINASLSGTCRVGP